MLMLMLTAFLTITETVKESSEEAESTAIRDRCMVHAHETRRT